MQGKSSVLRSSLQTRLRLSACMLYSYTAGILKLYLGQWDPKAKLKLAKLQKSTLMSNLIKCSKSLCLPFNSTSEIQN